MERIRAQRKKIGMTMKQLGTAVGVTEAAISHYETGKREPDNETLTRIANCLGASVDYLLGRDDQPQAAAPAVDPQLSEASALFAKLPEDQQRHIIENMKFLLSQKK